MAKPHLRPKASEECSAVFGAMIVPHPPPPSLPPASPAPSEAPVVEVEGDHGEAGGQGHEGDGHPVVQTWGGALSRSSPRQLQLTYQRQLLRGGRHALPDHHQEHRHGQQGRDPQGHLRGDNI